MDGEVGRDETIRGRDAPTPGEEVCEIGSIGPAGVFGEAVAEEADDGLVMVCAINCTGALGGWDWGECVGVLGS